MKKFGKKVIHFYNNSGSLENVIKFLENVQKKINYLNLNVYVEGKSIKITLFGSRDLQHLATERLKDLANRYLWVFYKTKKNLFYFVYFLLRLSNPNL